VAASVDPLLLTDQAGKILFANGAAVRLLNVRSGILKDRLLVTHVERSNRRPFRTYVNRAAAGESVRFSVHIQPHGLQPVPVQALVTPVRDGLAWVLRDETALPLERTPDSTEGLERIQLGEVLEGVRDGVVVVGRDLTVLFANGAAQAMLSPHPPTPGEPLDEPWRTSITPLVAGLLEHDAHHAEALLEPDERTAYWLRAFQSGAGDSVVLLVSDVTLEERRERSERDFVANAAHELQSPLTAIGNAVELLRSVADLDDEARERFLGHIARETDRLSRLLRSLLLLADAQGSEEEIALETLALRPILDEIASRSGNETVAVLCPHSLRVVAQAELLDHAITNLVANAIRHGNSAQIRIAARRTAGGTVLVDVVDAGPGMTAADRARAFERFYRGGARTGEGFGLGLSIAQQAARAVGGEIQLLANPEQGTIARLRLAEAA
jgi:two-component system, OmpR family, sensor histidine kinase VicK